jgi:hypothetical protein
LLRYTGAADAATNHHQVPGLRVELRQGLGTLGAWA